MGKLVPAVIALAGCAGGAPVRSQLEIRQMQTRVTDAADERLVLRAPLNVLLDEGFVLKTSDPTLGLLTASRSEDLGGPSLIDRALDLPDDVAWDTVRVTDVTVHVTSFGSRTRVRVSFEARTYCHFGNVSKVEAVQDPLVYQRFFSRVDKGVFLQRELE